MTEGAADGGVIDRRPVQMNTINSLILAENIIELNFVYSSPCFINTSYITAARS